MSGDDPSSTHGTPSNAINVGFSSVADQYGESSSQAESRSSGKRSQGSTRLHKQRKTGQVTEAETGGSSAEGGVEQDRKSSGHRVRKSGGFLLDSVLGNGSPPGRSDTRSKQRTPDGPLRVEKRRPASSHFSGDSSLRSSPLSHELQMDGADQGGSPGQRRSSQRQTMDPAQLVQMALNLSESRKRHVSNTLQVPLPAGRRLSSPNHEGARIASSGSKRGSHLSDSVGRSSASSDGNRSQVSADSPVDSGHDNVLHTFSPATLARAEKVRKYFELASDYRRLLENLPPLKPNASAPGNYEITTKSSPGSAFPVITRVPTHGEEKHELGRQYNPIQSLRNRRVRIRERRPFTAPPDSWQYPEQVELWIDDVKKASESEGFRLNGDQVELPHYPGEDESLAAVQPGSKGHRRTDTAGSVIPRPENSWTIEPTELLADVYWTEKGDNKCYIETRQGNPIFAKRPRQSVDTPKISVEMHRDRDEIEREGTDGSDTDEAQKHNRRRRLMLPLNRSSKTEKRKHRRILSRSGSESSDDSAASIKARRLRQGRGSLEDSIAPLERHMQELIEKDARGELSSPEVTSPDHWDPRNAHLARSRPSVDQRYRESIDGQNERASLEVPRPGHKRSKSADGRMNSIEKEMSPPVPVDSDPETPVDNGSYTSIDMSPPYNKRGSGGGQGSKSRLPTFRSQSKERRGVDQNDFADTTGSKLATILSADSGGHRSSLDSNRPHIFARHRTSETADKGLRRSDTDSTSGTVGTSKESGSTVGRFFKGRRDRIGGLVSNSFRGRDRAGTLGNYDTGQALSDVSDAEDTRPNGMLKKRRTEPTSAEISPRGSFERGRPKPKFYMSGLPSFTSSAREKQLRGETPGSANDASSRRQHEQGDTPRSDRLAPPKINVASASDIELDRGRIRWAKGYGDLSSRNSSVSPGDAAPRSGPGSAMKQQNRHWSIYDKAPAEQATQISSKDIARVRALLLASGIKAREIQRRADNPRPEAPQYLLDAAKTSGEELGDLPALKDEHLYASRLLSNYLPTFFTTFESSLSAFQTSTAKTLSSRTGALHSKVADQLSNVVHETSDEADAFTVELNTRGPQNTKQVLDAVDEMMRRRRRQWRWAVNVAFKVLEWSLLGLMWGIWAVVVVFNVGRKGVWGVGRVVRWLVVP